MEACEANNVETHWLTVSTHRKVPSKIFKNASINVFSLVYIISYHNQNMSPRQGQPRYGSETILLLPIRRLVHMKVRSARNT